MFRDAIVTDREDDYLGFRQAAVLVGAVITLHDDISIR